MATPGVVDPRDNVQPAPVGGMLSAPGPDRELRPGQARHLSAVNNSAQKQTQGLGLAPPATGFERFVERGLGLAGNRKGGGKRNRKTGATFQGQGPWRGKTKGQFIEWMRDRYSQMSDKDRAKYENQARMGDVTSKREATAQANYEKSRMDALGLTGHGLLDPSGSQPQPQASSPAQPSDPGGQLVSVPGAAGEIKHQWVPNQPQATAPAPSPPASNPPPGTQGPSTPPANQAGPTAPPPGPQATQGQPASPVAPPLQSTFDSKPKTLNPNATAGAGRGTPIGQNNRSVIPRQSYEGGVDPRGAATSYADQQARKLINDREGKSLTSLMPPNRRQAAPEPPLASS